MADVAANRECLVHLGMPPDARPSMKDLSRFLTEYAKYWKDIGINLGLHPSLIGVIEADNFLRIRECFRVTLQRWLEQTVNASWKMLELAITNAKRELANLRPISMEEMQMLPHQLAVNTQSVTVESVQPRSDDVVPIQESPSGQSDEIDGFQGYANDPAEIIPQTAPTVNCGKGMVMDDAFAQIKKTVCRIESPQMTGTGFIGYVKCSPTRFCTVLLTNNHVIPTIDDALGCRIIFENVFPHGNCALKGFEICIKTSFWCSRKAELDYTMIEIDETKLKDPETGRSFDIHPIHLTRPADIKNNDLVYVIQHPRGEKLAFSSSEVLVMDPLLLYECTTDSGSSGSPVLKEVDGELRFVALHRGGRERDRQRDGWHGYNCGTLIGHILNHLLGIPPPPLPSNEAVQEALQRRAAFQKRI